MYPLPSGCGVHYTIYTISTLYVAIGTRASGLCVIRCLATGNYCLPALVAIASK